MSVLSNDALTLLTYKPFLFDNDFEALFPELFLVSVGVFLLLYGVLWSTRRDRNYPDLLGNITWLTLFSLALTMALIVNNPFHTTSLFFNTLIVDDWTQFMKLLVLGSSFICIAMATTYVRQESVNAFEYMLLILFSTVSMLFLISSADFISMYLAVELQSLCFYVLAAIKRNSEFSTEAGLKYFLLGAFSSGLLIFGTSLVYGFTGITNFSDLSTMFAAGTGEILSTTSALPGCELGMVFILMGFFFKLAAAPFHMWSPDVYEGAPTSVTAYFVIAPKAAVFAVLLRIFLGSFYDLFGTWQTIVIVVSIVSMVVGALGALAQTRLKRFLAYSSIGHAGYLLAGMACGTLAGVQALVIYLVVYLLMNITIFALVLTPLARTGDQRPGHLKYITDLSNLGTTNPILAATLAITLFSIAGIPPLAGFYSKAYLFFATMGANLYVLAVVGVLTSVVSCFYYIRVIKIMYFEKPDTWTSAARVPVENATILALSLFTIIFLMAYPAPLHTVTHKVALSLCM